MRNRRATVICTVSAVAPPTIRTPDAASSPSSDRAIARGLRPSSVAVVTRVLNAVSWSMSEAARASARVSVARRAA